MKKKEEEEKGKKVIVMNLEKLTVKTGGDDHDAVMGP
jgi:hypothetical protein